MDTNSAFLKKMLKNREKVFTEFKKMDQNISGEKYDEKKVVRVQRAIRTWMIKKKASIIGFYFPHFQTFSDSPFF